MALTFTVPSRKNKEQIPQASPEALATERLAMHYFDRLPARYKVGEDVSEDYRPATLSFPTERSHRAAADIVKALEGESAYFRQMEKQLTEKENPTVDPMSLPDGVDESYGKNPDYDWEAYSFEDARHIRGKIGEAAAGHLYPENRPSQLSAELAEQAYLLDISAPSINEPPRNQDEEFMEIATRLPKTAAALAFEKEEQRMLRGRR